MSNRKLVSSLLLVGLVVVVAGCVEHRVPKTELYNENIYLSKDFLTRPNPNHTNADGVQDEYGWLMGLSVTAVSVPTPLPDIFPGLQGDTKYVRFDFSQNSLQITDGIVLGPYGADDNLGDPRDAQDLAPRILQEYPGEHVDLQMRRNLDGEITNYEEENKEKDWQNRQYFKVQLDQGAFSDLTKVSWYYDWAMSPAMELMSSSLVPDSFHYVDTVGHESNMGTGDQVDWDKGDYIEWTIRQVYKIDTRYASLMNYRLETATQTIDIKYSLWRRPDPPPGTEYVKRPIAEKDKYRRQFGIWDYVVHNYQDPDTGFVGAEMLLSRFNPRLPIDFYLIDVPQEYRAPNPEYDNMSVYDSVAMYANEVFEEAGVDARVTFHDQDEGGIHREFGDIRYSFVYWHNNAFTDIPWLGYGPSLVDPRNGEIFSATLNFNNWQGLHWYTEVTRDLLEQTSDAFDEEQSGACTPGEMRPILDEQIKTGLQNTTLFSKMTDYMGQEPKDWVVQHDEEWYDYYHMLLPDLRFFYPPYQTFVYSGREAGLQNMQSAREDLMEREKQFWDVASKLDSAESPTGYNDFTSPGAIEAGLDFLRETKDGMQAHLQMMADRQVAAGIRGIDLVQGPTLLSSIADINQRCKADGTWQTFEEWEDDIRWRISHQTSIHELGHDIGLWHNFMASVDQKHYQPCTGCQGSQTGGSSSVMDYVHHFAEVGADLGYYPYDKATLIYGYRYDSQEAVDQETDPTIIATVHPDWVDGTADGAKDGSQSYLFANDYHSPLSPLVETFDLGTTPTEIVYNAIQYYDWMYKFRNFRSYRQYWETWNYPNSAFYATYPMRRFLELWALDFDEADIENDLRTLGVEGDTFFFNNIRDQFTIEMGQANRMLVNFYRAILNQSNAERSYATTYDSYFGDVTQLGIIYDKFYAMMTFLGLWGADMYNWDVYAYLAYYEINWGDSLCYSDALETLNVMLGGSYDVYPWFLPTAVLLFAQDTHNISFGDQSKKEWIGFRTFDRAQDMVEYFGFDPRTQCLTASGVQDSCSTAALGAEGDLHQVFYDSTGAEWDYLYLEDRNQHVCANADTNPIAHKMIWDYNEDVNLSGYDWVTTYDIKYFIDYYQYFN